MARAFEYRHVVAFDETNLVGNVYYVNHLRWQGLCRERFIERHAPGALGEDADELTLVTTRCNCEYVAEIGAFDEIAVRMSFGEISGNTIPMRFEYVRVSGEREEIVARGEHEVRCMRRDGDGLHPAPVPDALGEAIRNFTT